MEKIKNVLTGRAVLIKLLTLPVPHATKLTRHMTKYATKRRNLMSVLPVIKIKEHKLTNFRITQLVKAKSLVQIAIIHMVQRVQNC